MKLFHLVSMVLLLVLLASVSHAAEDTTVPICNEGETRCDGTTSQICSDNIWMDQIVNDPACGYVHLCNEEETRCDGTTSQICSDNTWMDLIMNDADCGYEFVCNEEETRCNGTTSQICTDHTWVDQTLNDADCGYEFGCVEEETRCNGSTSQICTDHTWMDQIVNDPECGSSYAVKTNKTLLSLIDLFFPETTAWLGEKSVTSTHSCRYLEGTVIAWNSLEWQGKGEYQGEVLGKVVGYNESMPGATDLVNSSPVYVLMLHPYYRDRLSSLPIEIKVSEGTKLAYGPCSYLEERTKVWDTVDWESSLIKDENGTVIGKSNQTGLYHLVEGAMVEGGPTLAAPEVPPDPLEFSGTLLPWMRFEYDDETHDNILSLGINQARTMKGYMGENANGMHEKVMPDANSTFLLVYVDLLNRGHKSNNENFEVSTPEVSSYRVFYGGYNYTPLSLEGDIISGTYRWEPYMTTRLDRYEHLWGALLFEVPERINLSQTYFQADLGIRGTPIWQIR